MNIPDGELRTLEYRTGYDVNNEAEMREAIEKGRKYKIAAEVWNEVLDSRRDEIIRMLENSKYSCGEDKAMLSDILAELRVMRHYREISRMMIDLGELAERDLQKYGE